MRSHRPAGLLAAGLLSAAALVGCGSEVEGEASPSSESAGSSSAGASAAESSEAGQVEDLSAGLLPADAFGPGVDVTALTAEQVFAQQDQLGGGLGGMDDVVVTPGSCGPTVKGVQPGLDDIEGLAAQTATDAETGVTTVEILASGAAVAGSVEQLTTGIRDCPEASITSPETGTATVTFAPLEVPDLGDGSAAVTMTVEVPGPGGAPLVVPVLLGMVQDGDRLVSLTTTDPFGSADPVAFGQLLQQAFDHQADALD